MDKKKFNCKELAQTLVKHAGNGEIAYAACFFDEAAALLRELMSYENVIVSDIEVVTPEYNGYVKEYFITLSDDFKLDIAPAYVENENHKSYLWFEADALYIDGDANSAILRCMDCDKCVEVEFEEKETPEKDDINYTIEEVISLFMEKLFGDI